MPAPLRINLIPEEERTLEDLRVTSHIPQRTRDRAQMILANANGCNAPAIAQFMRCQERTVREAIKRWQVVWIMGCEKMRFQATLDGRGHGIFRRMFTEKTKNLQFVTVSTKVRKRETCTSK
jgi:hypothetical protein